MPNFPTFNGSRDTRRYDGHDYSTISFVDIKRMCGDPSALEKLQAPAFIPSTYAGSLARSHEEQRQRGVFHALIADVDIGSPSLADLEAAVVSVVGDHARLIYSSSSATEAERKWRVIVPVRSGINGADYGQIQEAYFNALSDRGITCDYALARTGQPVFLPNVPPARRGADGLPIYYENAVRELAGLSEVPPAITLAAKKARRQGEAAQAIAKESALRKAAERRQRRDHNGLLSPIEQFNADHDLTALMLQHGWEPRGGNSFASPYSQSKGPSVYVFDQRAVSFTSSDIGQIGKVSANGWATYDAWDVYVACVFGGNEAVALIEYQDRTGYGNKALRAILGKWGQS